MAIATGILVAGAIAAGSSAASSIYQAHKAGEAEQLQAKGTADALAYEKERDKYARETEANRYGALHSQTQPYRDTGVGSNTEMARLLGLPAPEDQATHWQHAATGPTSTGPAGGTTPTMGAMVMMQAPDGTTKNVPASEESHWTQRGAKRVS